ncbi:hypothetical protein [Cyclobacterium sp.]|uniref:toxin-antitoxin system YwqK family antitoxin n=1 Tax=Cyclobacterium sp. TaxID=1966343 RepID=UPI00199798E1|nr:hypothetical protein [Cyclobacterium sp.]MBD3628170.1 hypothetical protein [Cyclobacterium sp.]
MERNRTRKVNYGVIPRILSLIFLFNFGCSSNESEIQEGYDLESIVINYNKDSTKVVSFGFLNEKGQNGEWFFLDESQRIEKIQTFKNGILNGPVTEFLCCQKFSTYTYKNGKLEGEIVYYSKEGYISSKGYFKNGKLNGVWADFYEGVLLSVSEYSEDKKIDLYQNPLSKKVVIGDEFFGCCERN